MKGRRLKRRVWSEELLVVVVRTSESMVLKNFQWRQD